MNNRGFNLFTALVAAVIIMIGVLLALTMIDREASTSGQISSMKQNFTLSDAATIARADAIQTFSNNFRIRLEDFLTYDEDREEYGIRVLNIRSNGTNDFGSWEGDDGVVRSFEKSILFTDSWGGTEFKAVIKFVADNIVNEFREETYGRYRISLSKKDHDAVIAAISNATSNAPSNYKFFEVVDCEGDAGSCNTGTFYFNLPLDKMSTEDYEKLPRIVARDIISQEEIKIALLPKSRLRIYIPLRFFKALFEARKNAQVLLNEHNILNNYKLGFCNPSSCAPMKNPELLGGTFWDKQCPGNFGGISVSTADYSPPNYNPFSNNYAVLGEPTGKNGIAQTSINRICVAANSTNLDSGDPTFVNANLNDPMKAPGSTERITPCPFKEINVVPKSFQTNRLQGVTPESGPTGYLYCSNINHIQADVLLKETNEQYMVTTSQGEKFYRITIVDESFGPLPEDTYTECVNETTTNKCRPA